MRTSALQSIEDEAHQASSFETGGNYWKVQPSRRLTHLQATAIIPRYIGFDKSQKDLERGKKFESAKIEPRLLLSNHYFGPRQSFPEASSR
jgi:hypothetical protein